MPFDQPTRNRLARFVADARTLLTAEFTRQLQHEYGLDPTSGAVTPLERLTHLDDARRETARILRATLDHYLAGGDGRGVNAQQEALDRIVREQAFTVLNRLCALRMAEARGLLIESIARGYQSKGFQLYARLAGPALGETGDAYRCYLFSLFDEFAVDLAVLFDRFSPQGRLFPGATTLLHLLDLLNHPDLDALWAEDETIGWIYQYFNSREERKAMRDASQAPRNSRELAVRNQFFTPRYVVEFLTDNTLGRIWYEMTKGETGLKDTCRYLVRRPHEIFLSEGETAPTPAQPAEDLSQEELLNQPVYIPHRPLKDPRQIKMLDPACGSMHFGLYAFDLFERIYTEAWDLGTGMRGGGDASPDSQPAFAAPHAPTGLAADYATKEELLLDLPRLILEHNIHGIDIDPRAVQIAGLSLWLRAQRSWQAQGVKAQDRPPIRRSHIVCAEPMPGETGMLAEFAATLQPPVLGQLVKVIFEKMKLAGEAGSLLKIEEELADAVAEAKRQWLAGGKPEQGRLFPDDTPRQMGLELDLSGITDEAFWDRGEALVLDALQEYAELTDNGNSYQRRLFAGDAARGFAFIDLCRKQYDLVLMNPPFGTSTQKSNESISSAYPDAKNDIYAAFVGRGLGSLVANGILGAITGRNGFVHSALSVWRETLLTRFQLSAVADFGAGVLDAAFVETAAYTIAANKLVSDKILFMDLRNESDKQNALLQTINSYQCASFSAHIFERTTSFFASLPRMPLVYQATSRIHKLFTDGPRFEDTIGNARLGLRTLDDFRYIRLVWEVDHTKIGWEKHWVMLNKGGSYSHFYFDFHLLLKWQDNGLELKTVATDKYESASRIIQAESFYSTSGLTYPRRSLKGFSVRVFPASGIFTDKGASIFLAHNQDPFLWLGILNSTVYSACVELQSGSASYEVGYIQRLPAISVPAQMATEIRDAAEKATLTKRSLLTTDVTSPIFCKIWPVHNTKTILALHEQLTTLHHQSTLTEHTTIDTIDQILNNHLHIDDPDKRAIREILAQRERPSLENNNHFNLRDTVESMADFVVGTVYGRWDIRFATGERQPPELPDPFAPLPICPPGMLQNAQGLPATPADVPAGYPLRISWPGILVDDEDHPEDIVRRVREVLQVIWPANHDAIEGEACELLGVRTLRDYFRKPAAFFADHLKRYSKSRRQAPIYWPLSTPSGSYTLWLYYHRLTGQTLYTCVNDFVDPKLKTVTEAASVLRQKSNRTRTEEKELEQLGDLALELQDFRSELLRIAAFWQPNLNDGVQITAAPLWRLFQHRPWQKRLKETWEKLAAGDYDWAHLAYTIWPDRVAAKCQTDKSLAIAHNLEHLYVEPPATAKKKGGRKKAVAAEQDELFGDGEADDSTDD